MMPKPLRWVREKCIDSTVGKAALLGGSHAVQAVSLVKGAASAMAGNVMGVLKAGAVALAAAAAPRLVGRLSELRSSNQPPPGAMYTVRIVNGIPISYKGENLAYILKYRRETLSHLEPVYLTSHRPDKAAVNEAASTMLLSKKPPAETRRLVAARCLRQQMAEPVVMDTLEAAAGIADRISAEPKNEEPAGVFVTHPPVFAGFVAALVASIAVTAGAEASLNLGNARAYATSIGEACATAASQLVTSWPGHKASRIPSTFTPFSPAPQLPNQFPGLTEIEVPWDCNDEAELYRRASLAWNSNVTAIRLMKEAGIFPGTAPMATMLSRMWQANPAPI